MSTKIMLATLALGATIAFAGPAFAEKMKATLDGKSEVPATTSAGTGTADIDWDAATKKLSWKITYSGLTGPATAAHFHGPADPSKNAAVAVAIPEECAGTSPVEGSATHDRRPGGGSGSRQLVFQRPHRGQSRRRNPRPGDQVSPRSRNLHDLHSKGRAHRAPAPFSLAVRTIVRSPGNTRSRWQWRCTRLARACRPAKFSTRLCRKNREGKHHDLSGRPACSAAAQ